MSDLTKALVKTSLLCICITCGVIAENDKPETSANMDIPDSSAVVLDGDINADVPSGTLETNISLSSSEKSQENDDEAVDDDDDINYALLISIITAAVLAVSAFFTYRTSENRGRPILLLELRPDLPKHKIMLSVTNLTTTDAEGGVHMRVLANEIELPHDDPAYNGKMRWLFPAKQRGQGNLNIEGLLSPYPHALIEIEAGVFYRRWYRWRLMFRTWSKIYYAPPKRWKYDKGVWIPELALKRPLYSPEANKAVFSKKHGEA